MFTKILFAIVSLFLIWGGLEYLSGRKGGMGESFEDGIKAIGPLALNMIGIFVLAPLLSEGIQVIGEPIANLLGIDMSLLPTSVLAIDMGGYQLGMTLSQSEQMGLFSGIIISSGLGATISFSIPVALGMIKEEDKTYFLKGLVLGLIAMPFGAMVGGIVQGIPMGVLIKNCIPMMVGVIGLGILIMWRPEFIIKCFSILSKIIVAFSIIGLIVIGVVSVMGLDLPMWNVAEAAQVVVKIGLFLAGAYPMLYFIRTRLQKPLGKLGARLGVNENTVAGLLGNLASNLLVFSQLENMDERGKIIASAFAISGAFVCGGQLAFVNTIAPEMVVPFIVSKVVGGVLAMVLALLFCYAQERKKVQEN